MKNIEEKTGALRNVMRDRLYQEMFSAKEKENTKLWYNEWHTGGFNDFMSHNEMALNTFDKMTSKYKYMMEKPDDGIIEKDIEIIKQDPVYQKAKRIFVENSRKYNKFFFPLNTQKMEKIGKFFLETIEQIGERTMKENRYLHLLNASSNEIEEEVTSKNNKNKEDMYEFECLVKNCKTVEEYF
jgi:hypothetical protein